MKHSIVRDTIIETASNLFYQNGYNLTGINEIIKEAGIAKATLYSHFRSKDDICLAFLDHRHQIFLSQVKLHLEQAEKGNRQILGLFDFLNTFFNGKDFNGCACLNTISEIPKEDTIIRAEIQSQKRELIRLIEKVIEESFPGKSETWINHKSKQVYILYEGALSECSLHRESWPITSAREMCEQILV